jgi:nucleoporin POM34
MLASFRSVASCFAPSSLTPTTTRLLTTGALLDINTHPDVLLFLIRVFFLVNMLVALYPLYRPRDDFTDIPLTPSQRALLGLDPKTASPATPGSTYVTPPRYRLSSGSRNVSPLGLNKTPPSARGSPFNATTKAQDTSPLSPSASPLLHKAIKTGNRDSGRRFSFDSTSSLGRSGLRDTSLFSGPPTPSPTGGRRSSQIFTNKWLYEKSRMHSPDSSVYGR